MENNWVNLVASDVEVQ